MQFLGEMTFTFTLDKQEFEITVKYLENMPYPILLGTDFLNKCGACINFKDHTVMVPLYGKVYAQQTYQLQPGEETTVYGQLPDKPGVNSIAVAIPTKESTDQVSALPTIVELKDTNRLVPMTLVNTTDVMVTIQGDHIANLEMVDSLDSIYDTEICTPPETLKSSVVETSPNITQFETCFQWDGTTLSEENLITLKDLLWE